MSSLVRFWTFFIVLLSLPSWGQDFQFRMDSSFPVPTESVTPTNVTFTVRWNEQNNRIIGTYSDNYFISSTRIDGLSGAQARTFNVSFPEVRNGVKSMTILLDKAGLASGSASLTISTRDASGIPINTYNVAGVVTTNTTGGLPTDETTECSEGFGDLTGYCGIYAGTITETSDDGFLCNGIASPNTRLELGTNTQLAIYLGYQNSLIGLPMHRLGGLPTSPGSTKINISTRNCGELPGATFNRANCQILNLNGTFSTLAGSRLFYGTYNIRDEVSGDTCTFTMDLTREEAF